jgi:hypothetical protein
MGCCIFARLSDLVSELPCHSIVQIYTPCGVTNGCGHKPKKQLISFSQQFLTIINYYQKLFCRFIAFAGFIPIGCVI